MALSRIARLDGIIQRLYEDNLEGRVSDERFSRMSASYETEQRTLEARVTELRKLLADVQDKQVNIDRFLALVRKYTDIQELTSEVLREFVEKVYVQQTQRIDGQRCRGCKSSTTALGSFRHNNIKGIAAVAIATMPFLYGLGIPKGNAHWGRAFCVAPRPDACYNSRKPCERSPRHADTRPD